MFQRYYSKFTFAHCNSIFLRKNISQNYHHRPQTNFVQPLEESQTLNPDNISKSRGGGNKTRRRQSLVNHPSIPLLPCKLSIRTEMMSIRHFHKVNIQSRVNPGDLSRLILQSSTEFHSRKLASPPPPFGKFNTTTNIENIVQSSSSSVSSKPRNRNLDW